MSLEQPEAQESTPKVEALEEGVDQLLLSENIHQELERVVQHLIALDDQGESVEKRSSGAETRIRDFEIHKIGQTFQVHMEEIGSSDGSLRRREIQIKNEKGVIVMDLIVDYAETRPRFIFLKSPRGGKIRMKQDAEGQWESKDKVMTSSELEGVYTELKDATEDFQWWYQDA